MRSTTTTTVYHLHRRWGQNGLFGLANASERAAVDDAVGRDHQRHDWHVCARGSDGLVHIRGGGVPLQPSLPQEGPCLPRQHGRALSTFLTGIGTAPP